VALGCYWRSCTCRRHCYLGCDTQRPPLIQILGLPQSHEIVHGIVLPPMLSFSGGCFLALQQRPNNSFKPKTNRYAIVFGLIQALGPSMRILTVDQFEFPDHSTEEWVEIATAAKSDFPYPTVSEFAAAATDSSAAGRLGSATPFSDSLGYGLIRKYLQHFAGISLPPACSWPTYVITDGPSSCHVILYAPNSFIRYEWRTAA